VSPAGPAGSPEVATVPTPLGALRPSDNVRVSLLSPADPPGRGYPGGAAGAAEPSWWPEEIPEPPGPGRPGTGSLAPYLGWLDGAARVLSRRVEQNRAELDRLGAEWAHVVRNLDRLRPEEISSVVEGQARLREVIASDRALRQLIEVQRRQVAGWSEALSGSGSDDALVGRLLDDVAEERARMAAAMLEVAVEAVAGAVLDLEVVRREAMRDPTRAARGLVDLRQRLTAAAAALRERAQAASVRSLPGEALHAVLGRFADAHRPAVRAEVVWSGPEVADERAAAAIRGIVLECLHHLAGAPGTAAQIAVGVDRGGSVAVRIASDGAGLLPEEDAPWLVRARSHAALAGGRLLCGRAGAGSVVELRFP
jgi:hypothetical protein